MKKNNFWVLSRIYAGIERMPVWNESISIRTWPRGKEKLFALRDFIVYDSEEQPIARATSSWLIVDRDTKRIQRPENTLSNYATFIDDEKALERNAFKVEPAHIDGKESSMFSVRLSDLDINLHTNNTRYLKWVCDIYDLDFVLNNTPLSAEINYLAESHFNDIIKIMTSQENSGRRVFNHSIIKSPDNSELCRVKICWKEIYN